MGVLGGDWSLDGSIAVHDSVLDPLA